MLLALVVLLVTPSAFGQARDSSSLDVRVRAETRPFKGKVTLFAKNLDSGETYSLDGDERVRTASTIKIAVMIEAFGRVAEGRAKWTDELVLTKAARYAGSGGVAGAGGWAAADTARLRQLDDADQRQHRHEHGA